MDATTTPNVGGTTKQLPVRLDLDLYNQIKAISYLTGTSMNSMIGTAVAKWLETEGRQELINAAGQHGRERYRVILDKLKDL
jgi:hypothetical protein